MLIRLVILKKVSRISNYFNPFCPADQKRCMSNSVDPDETACNKPSHQDLHCLPFVQSYLLRKKNIFFQPIRLLDPSC